MPEEFGTRDVFEQIDARLNNVEQDLRSFRSDVSADLASSRSEVREEFRVSREDVNRRLDHLQDTIATQSRWYISLLLTSWIAVIGSIWLKP